MRKRLEKHTDRGLCVFMSEKHYSTFTFLFLLTVPADDLLINGHSLAIDESSMTGESKIAHKDQKSPFLMYGCKVADGAGTMMVTGVGINTEWGLLMASISDTAEETPLQVWLNGVATFINIVSFIELCQKLDLLVMLRAGPYICAEWDFGGFPAWLLTKEPSIRLRSSDPVYLTLVDKWWGTLLPKIALLLYHKGGPIVMLQIENEFGSYGVDKDYLHHLVNLARSHLGDDLILWEGLSNFESNNTHFLPSALEIILSRNGSAVLYMAHGGTNFGFYNGVNAQESESNYLADLTSYDYDAPISESGYVDGAKFKASRSVIAMYSAASLSPVPKNNEKTGYGGIKLEKTSSLFDILDSNLLTKAIESDNPISMEVAGQMFGFLLYTSEYTANGKGSTLSIPKVNIT
ncbi:hypothetical protein LXL04_026190 [Taraxacum kok-saghyz]